MFDEKEFPDFPDFPDSGSDSDLLPNYSGSQPTTDLDILSRQTPDPVASQILTTPTGLLIPDHDTIPNLFPRSSLNFIIYKPFDDTLPLILPQLENYTASTAANPIPFLELPTPAPPEQLGLILFSTHPDDMRQTVTNLGLTRLNDPQICPVTSCHLTYEIEEQSEKEIEAIKAGYETRIPGPLDLALDDLTRQTGGIQPRFLFIDSIHLLGAKQKLGDVHSIAGVCRYLKRFCIDHDCTILATIVTQKGTNRYEYIPDRMYGSVQWAAHANTVFAIEPQRRGGHSKITIMSQDSRQKRRIKWALPDLNGRLNLCPPPEIERDRLQDQLEQYLEDVEPGKEFTRQDLQAKGQSYGISSRSVDRWIAECVSAECPRLLRKGSGNKVVFAKPLIN